MCVAQGHEGNERVLVEECRSCIDSWNSKRASARDMEYRARERVGARRVRLPYNLHFLVLATALDDVPSHRTGHDGEQHQDADHRKRDVNDVLGGPPARALGLVDRLGGPTHADGRLHVGGVRCSNLPRACRKVAQRDGGRCCRGVGRYGL